MTNDQNLIPPLTNSNLLVWQKPEIIRWSQILVNSYKKLLGKELIKSANTPEELAAALFTAPFVVVSHDTQVDPILNYGNEKALQLWSVSWDELTQTPSRLTAEPVNQATRAATLQQVTTQGYIKNYQGIRISRTGQRFLIKQAIIWNLTNELGQKWGQAATFSDWNWV
ncbi:MAG: MEKHLA domain-containing protein [Waterburya sp.]